MWCLGLACDALEPDACIGSSECKLEIGAGPESARWAGAGIVMTAECVTLRLLGYGKSQW